MILVIFRDFSNFWKKKIIYNEKRNFFFVQNLKWATAHLSRRLGAGLGCWACRRWAGAGRARGVRGQRRGALGWGAGRAQAGTAGVRGRWAWRAGRRAWAPGHEQAGCSSARAQWARGRARQAGRRRAGRERQARRGRAGRAAWAWPGRLGWPGLCTRCTRLDFQTGFRLGIFPESVNEHCSL